jgi:hypothetical protein
LRTELLHGSDIETSSSKIGNDLSAGIFEADGDRAHKDTNHLSDTLLAPNGYTSLDFQRLTDAKLLQDLA